jgi:hypothetical protein
MPTLFILSNLFFLTLLIRSSLKGDSDQRFILKTIACFHFVFLALWALMSIGIKTNQDWLIVGLLCAFLGDVALGLKHKWSWARNAGFLFFGLTQLSYILFFGISALMIGVAAPFYLVLGIVTWRIKGNPAYDFKGMGRVAIMYAAAMILMMSCAIAHMILGVTEASMIQALGAVLFVASDVTLLNQYYLRQKKTGLIPVYLILYHTAQNLMALSLWLM